MLRGTRCAINAVALVRKKRGTENHNSNKSTLLYMFGSNPRTSPASNGTPNYNSAPNRLSGDVSIKGDVTCGSELVIEGEVNGTITSAGTLTIGAHGKVTGDIEAGFVTIQGLVEGNVLARERCALKAGANLQGDVEAPRLAVDETASFVGKATITAADRA